MPNHILSMLQHMAAEQQACANHTKHWNYPIRLIMGIIMTTHATCNPDCNKRTCWTSENMNKENIPLEMMRQWSAQSSATFFHTCYWDQISNADIVLLSSQWDTGFTFVRHYVEFLFTFQTAPGRSASKCKKKRFTLMDGGPCKEQAHIYLPCDPAFWNTPVASMRPEVFCFVRLVCLSWTNSKSYSN